MNRLVQGVLGVLLVVLLLQAAVYIKSSPLVKTAPFIAAVPDTPGAPPDTPEMEGANAKKHVPRQNAAVAGPRNGAVEALRPNEKGKSAQQRHRYTYPFLMDARRTCRRNSTELVVVVLSAVANFEERQSVRDTWGSYANDSRNNVSLVFLVGREPGSPSFQSKLALESRAHGDLVQGDFVDSYRNLTLKSVALLNWVTQFCARATYVLKVDDDIYVNMPNLLAALRKESQAHSVFVMGHVFEGATPVQNKRSKWYTPQEQFSEKVYPRYTSGTTYSMTMAAAKRLYRATAQIPLFWLEDIYVTGLCARAAKVPVVHHSGFRYRPDSDTCHMRKAITAHKVTAERKRTLFKEMYDPEFKCVKQ